MGQGNARHREDDGWPRLTEHDRRAIAEIHRELDRVLGPVQEPPPPTEPHGPSPVADPAAPGRRHGRGRLEDPAPPAPRHRSSPARARRRARPRQGLRLAVVLGTLLAAALAAALVLGMRG